MIKFELYQRGRPVVVANAGPDANPGAWARLQEAFSRGIVGGSLNRIDVRVDVFFAELAAIQEIRRLFGESVELGPTLRDQLQLLKTDRLERERAIPPMETYDISSLPEQLRAAGFTRRELMPFQLENLATIVRLPHGADFSVPGAGKTSVALANFALGRARGRVAQLLVIAPIAAFHTWKEDAAACLEPAPTIAVHSGPNSFIPDDVDIVLTNYNRVASDYDRIREFVARRPTQVVLDEAHRIKRGELGVHGRAVLDLAYAARRRDVLTGTPAPQGAFDLVALMRFLYPGQDRQILPPSVYVERDGREDHVLQATGNAIARYFVRTPKAKLDLPPTTFSVELATMRPLQKAIYDALAGRYRGHLALDTSSRRKFDRLGRIVMYLMEAATNPMLLVAGSEANDDQGFAHPPLDIRKGEPLAELLQRYREYEVPWKYDRVREIVAEAASRKQKVIVWSTFVRNLRSLALLLEEHNPAVVHGGVPPEDGAPANAITREQELDRFRHEDDCHVLLANPAACGEGVSLHHWCHHAVYLDRSFNAGHFLQSQDRIHRLGLRDDVMTRFTLLLSEGTIDQTVDSRLREKVQALGRLMDDSGLVRVSLPEPDAGQLNQPAFADDERAVIAHLREAVAHAP
ncbi:SNF2 family DNA or RNA helicase [Saccharothrix ecbatanensis]|uniref:SNF2 family DNA or RNA helicase n=1 Tax=Saccharothrix ecbatanensis TaxID=1105145 RepID=A0A7W9HRT7_9PSEU|nr:DEAD/DEAH box helicase [Saccharothrix ecbatanensis]MBB5807300.1 SNF2 family DNA or RNA helicase [Saccharothrix ecbatanensis]